MSWTTNKVGSNDKNRKIDWFKLKKIVLCTVQGDQFLYISHKFDYKFGSWLLKCFSLNFSIPLSHCLLLLLYPLPLSSFLSTCKPDGWCVDTCPISTFLKSLCSSCKTENHRSCITSTLIWPESWLQSIQCSGSNFLLRYFRTPPLSSVSIVLIRINKIS